MRERESENMDLAICGSFAAAYTHRIYKNNNTKDKTKKITKKCSNQKKKKKKKERNGQREIKQHPRAPAESRAQQHIKTNPTEIYLY